MSHNTILWIYIVFLLVGGLIGFLKAGSKVSLIMSACFAAALGVGAFVARRRTALNVISGVLGCSVLFYLVSNSAAWLGDAYYTKTVAGWWQAMTVGHIEFPPTLWFFRNTLVGDLLFTGAFALVMARAAVTKPRIA